MKKKSILFSALFSVSLTCFSQTSDKFKIGLNTHSNIFSTTIGFTIYSIPNGFSLLNTTISEQERQQKTDSISNNTITIILIAITEHKESEFDLKDVKYVTSVFIQEKESSLNFFGKKITQQYPIKENLVSF